MVKLILTFMSVGIFATAVWYRGYVSTQLVLSSEVVGDKVSPSPSTSPTVTPTALPVYPSPTPTTTSKPVSEATKTTIFVYPTARLIKQQGGVLELETNDSPQAVLEWYKTVLSSNNFSITTRIVSQANDVHLTKVQARSTQGAVEITIQKDSAISATLISVTFTSSNL